MKNKYLIPSFLILLSLLVGCNKEEKNIKLGILHSLSGTLSISEQAVVNATLMAIDEINIGGGLLGKKIEPIVTDGESNIDKFMDGAKDLIEKKQVKALFACWTSQCRKAILPIVEENNNLLFYPVQFEGLENTKSIIYTGAAPNQQIIPGTIWALRHLGKRIYLVGTNSVFPRTAHRIIRSVSHLSFPLQAKIVGDKYIPLGNYNFANIINDINKVKPDVIISTIHGDSNTAFIDAIKGANLKHIPIMSFTLSENEIAKIGKEKLAGLYATWSYFQHLDNLENRKFIERYKKRYGNDAAIGDAMVSAYIAVKLWAQTVKIANSFEPSHVKRSIGHQTINSPAGIVYIDSNNHYLWKKVYIGQMQSNGLFKTIEAPDSTVAPTPYPVFHSKNDWDIIQQRIAKSLK
ncbi:MAG: urea ABC transporter substrate-binding protein [Gammaproteobacteria bacterium]|nr:urea ABC transporter substrate-binding protein [Gammaproteobacteria bacterium]